MILFAQPVEQFPKTLAFSTAPTVSLGADASFPPSNFLTYDPTAVARVNTNEFELNWDFGRQRKFDVVSLLHSNVGVRGVWRIEASVDGANYVSLKPLGPFWAHLEAIVTSVPVGAQSDEDLDPTRGSFERNHSFWYSPTVQNYRYLRILIRDLGSTVPLTFGRLFVGRSFRPKTSYQYGSAITFDDTSIRDRTDRGALILDPGKNIVGASVKMDFLSTDEIYDFVYDFNYWRGSAREMLCCLDINTTRRLSKNLLYATITEGRRVTADQFNTWSQTWILESI